MVAHKPNNLKAISYRIDIRVAKTKFQQLMERAHNGEEIVLTKNGKAQARLMPLQQPPILVCPLGFLNQKLSAKSNAVLFESVSEKDFLSG